MNQTELAISFGDPQVVVLNTAVHEGLIIKETHDKITIKFVGDDPAYYANKLERFRNKGVVMMAKRDNDPRRRLQGLVSDLSEAGATIVIGKYPVGVDIDHQEAASEAPQEANETSLVAQLLARLDASNAQIEALKAEKKETPQASESGLMNAKPLIEEEILAQEPAIKEAIEAVKTPVTEDELTKVTEPTNEEEKEAPKKEKKETTKKK